MTNRSLGPGIVDLHHIAPKIDTLITLARRQHRNVTRAQALALGLSPNTIQRGVERGWLHREHLGVYSVGTPATTPLERASAAVLACGNGAALSHGSALAVWGFGRAWGRAPHVTTPSRIRRPGIATHQRALTRADIRTHMGIRVTSLARTLLDCAPTMTARARTRAINDGLRSPYLTPTQLADVCQRNPRHPGARLLGPFTEKRSDGPTRSQFEDAFLDFCQRFGLPRPLVNTTVTGYEVDALFAAERVIVELDGWDFHNDRRAFENDRARDADLLTAGFVTIRITWERLHNAPRREAARLRQILAERSQPRV